MQLSDLAWCVATWLRARHRAISNGGLTHSRLLAVALLRYDGGAASISVPVDSLNGGEKLSIHWLYAGAIYRLNCSLNLAFVDLFESIE